MRRARIGYRATVACIALASTALACTAPDDTGASSGGSSADEGSASGLTSTAGPSTFTAQSEVLETEAALAELDRLMGPETFGTELTAAPRVCPLVDADQTFTQIADQFPDDDVVRALRERVLDTLLMSIPERGVSVATCMANAATPNSTIERVALEVRPASETIESLLDLTMEPGSVTLQHGAEHRGGVFYRYCGTRPDNVRKACAAGWRNADLDIALTVSGVEADLVDLDAAQTILSDLLDDVVQHLAP